MRITAPKDGEVWGGVVVTLLAWELLGMGNKVWGRACALIWLGACFGAIKSV